MDKIEFETLFREAIQRAGIAFLGESAANRKDIHEIEVHAHGAMGNIIPLNKVVDYIYLGNNRFYVIIDVGIIVEKFDSPVGFVRVSGHEPVDFSRTYNPSDLGPFKVLAPFHNEHAP